MGQSQFSIKTSHDIIPSRVAVLYQQVGSVSINITIFAIVYKWPYSV